MLNERQIPWNFGIATILRMGPALGILAIGVASTLNILEDFNAENGQSSNLTHQ
jgi:hypothetical protein